MLPGAAAEVRLSCPPTFRGALIAAAAVAGADDAGRSAGGAA